MIGILGGIGSGKSSVVRHSKHYRLCVIDADKIAHDLLTHPSIVQQVRDLFGPAVLLPDGGVNRTELANRVFGPSYQHEEARSKLENVLHPAVRAVAQEKLKTLPQDVDAVILDAALLLEAGWADDCDGLIFIETPLHLRQLRVLQNRGWSSDELARREACQLSVAEKKRRAEFIVDNSGTIDAAASQLNQFIRIILDRHHSRPTDPKPLNAD